jgi:hypothetical protein
LKKHDETAGEQDDGHDKHAEKREPAIPERVGCVSLLLRDLRETPRDPQCEAVSQIVQGVSEHGHAVRPEPTNDLQNSEREIQEKGKADPLADGNAVGVFMMVVSHVVITILLRSESVSQLHPRWHYVLRWMSRPSTGVEISIAPSGQSSWQQ